MRDGFGWQAKTNWSLFEGVLIGQCVVPGDSVADVPPLRPTDARFNTDQTEFGELAQLGERLVCNQEVTGSSPVFSTIPRSLTRALDGKPERLSTVARRAKVEGGPRERTRV